MTEIDPKMDREERKDYQSGFTSVLQWIDNAHATHVKASSSIVLTVMFLETGFFFT